MKIKCRQTMQIVDKLHENGAKCYIVGGFVRDHLLGLESKDIDIELHNISLERAYEVINQIYPSKLVGKFGVIIPKGIDTEFAIARTEHKQGKKHTEFNVDFITNNDLKLAASRRDFTINSLMYDIQNDMLIDNYGGLLDLKKKLIRHITPAFSEDPLRVLRCCRFAARLDFAIADKTYELCMGIAEQLNYLPSSRIANEISLTVNQSEYSKVHGKLVSIIAKCLDVGIVEYSVDLTSSSVQFKKLAICMNLDAPINALDFITESKKEKKDISFIINNYENICNISGVSPKEKYELLKNLKYSEKLASELNPQIERYLISYKHACNTYNGNYFKSLGYSGKEIAVAIQKQIMEVLDEL